MKTIGDKLEAFSVSRRQARLQPARGKRRLGVRDDHREELSRASGRSSTSSRRTSPSSARPRSSASTSWPAQFEERDAVLLGGSTDNEFSKLGWRREHKDLTSSSHWSFGDSTGSLVDQLGVRDKDEGVALRATFIVDPDNTIQHVT